MRKMNVDVRSYAKEQDIKLWQIAEALGISECTFSKSLRHELQPKRKEEIYEAIRKLAAQG